MTYIPHTEELEGLTLKIVADDSGLAESPVENDEAVIMVVLHRRYANPAAKRTLFDSESNSYDFTTPEGVAKFEEDNQADDSEWAVFPLFMYDHSGTSYRPSRGGNPFTCQWDSGRVGIIALKKDEVNQSKDFFEQAESVCETYTDWANGNIFGFEIEDEDGKHIDSCWGFIGDYDGYVLEEGRDSLKHAVEQRAKQKTEDAIRQLAEDQVKAEAERQSLADIELVRGVLEGAEERDREANGPVLEAFNRLHPSN